MPRARGWLVALLVGLVLVWAALTYTGPGSGAAYLPPNAVGPPAAGAAASGPLDLDAATARLQERLGSAAARPDPPQRNPFRFGGEPAPRPGPADESAVRTPLPAVNPDLLTPAAPALTLVGLVERTVDGQRERTAVVSVGGALEYAVAGRRIRGGFEVVAVGTDAVELRSLTDGSTRRLVLP